MLSPAVPAMEIDDRLPVCSRPNANVLGRLCFFSDLARRARPWFGQETGHSK